MKILSYFAQILFSLFLLAALIYWLTGFNSAFEADQSCHYELSTYSQGSDKYGCDHDTETHQWILYERQDDSLPSKVVNRFRYKFL